MIISTHDNWALARYLTYRQLRRRPLSSEKHPSEWRSPLLKMADFGHLALDPLDASGEIGEVRRGTVLAVVQEWEHSILIVVLRDVNIVLIEFFAENKEKGIELNFYKSILHSLQHINDDSLLTMSFTFAPSFFL